MGKTLLDEPPERMRGHWNFDVFAAHYLWLAIAALTLVFHTSDASIPRELFPQPEQQVTARLKTIHGVAAGATFDALGRVATESNALRGAEGVSPCTRAERR